MQQTHHGSLPQASPCMDPTGPWMSQSELARSSKLRSSPGAVLMICGAQSQGQSLPGLWSGLWKTPCSDSGSCPQHAQRCCWAPAPERGAAQQSPAGRAGCLRSHHPGSCCWRGAERSGWPAAPAPKRVSMTHECCSMRLGLGIQGARWALRCRHGWPAPYLMPHAWRGTWRPMRWPLKDCTSGLPESRHLPHTAWADLHALSVHAQVQLLSPPG